MKCFLVSVTILILTSLAACDSSSGPIDPREELRLIAEQVGFSKFNNETREGLKKLVDKVIDNSPPLQEKLTELSGKEEIIAEDRQQLMSLFNAACEKNKSIYRVEAKEVLKDVPRQMLTSLKDKIIAIWNRVKNFFKRAWRMITGKSNQNIREKRFLIMPILFFVADIFAIIIICKFLFGLFKSNK